MIAIAIAVTLTACGSSSSPEQKRSVAVRINGAEVRAELAEGEPARERGLSGRAGLAEGRGMLFVYGDHIERTYWMKGMRFPIDIVWIDRGRVTGIERNLPVPQGHVPLYSSRGPADRVLEVPAGWTGRHGVEPGDQVSIGKGG